MMNVMRRPDGFKLLQRRLIAALVVGALTACGGGGDADAPVASANSQLFSYLPATLTRLYAANIPAYGVSAGGHASHYVQTSGSLPPGLTLNASTGTISGTPTQSGTYSAGFSLTIDGYTGSAPAIFTATVVEPSISLFAKYPSGDFSRGSGRFLIPGIAIKNQDIRLSDLSRISSQVQYQVSGSVPLPPGLNLDPTTGVITGNPTTPGVWVVRGEATVIVQGNTYKLPFVAPISVGAVIQEHAGQTAAPVRIPVYLSPGESLTTNPEFSNDTTSLVYDPISSSILVSPKPILTGSHIGAHEYNLILTLSTGETATAGYVGVVDSTLIVDY